jgi:hypothetical protein
MKCLDDAISSSPPVLEFSKGISIEEITETGGEEFDFSVCPSQGECEFSLITGM